MQPTRSELTALAVALAPFVVYFGESRTQTVNGQVISHYDYNYAGVVLGIVAIVLVVRALRRLPAEVPAQARTLHWLVLAGISVLAVYQIARGASLLA
jgi:surface polysaccharide O-acyltransferase-like enzyme